jgi:uncharacterized protein with GYD domain
MPTYIMLSNWTDQGARAAKDTTKRAEAARELARKMGATVKDFYWTLGHYDLVLIVDAPDNATATAFGVSVGALGNVRTHTLPAFNAEEMGKILGRV